MTEQEPNLEDTLSAAFDSMQETPEEATETPAAGLRDAHGRFQSRQAPAEMEITAVEPEAPAEEITDQGENEGEAEAPAPIDTPASWSAEAKEIFAKLPLDAQKYIAQRESERETFLTQKSQEAATLKRQFEPLNQLIEPRRNVWASNGLSPEQAIGQLIGIAERATANPVEFIKQFASDNGIDLATMAQTPGNQGQPTELAPVISEINSIKQQLHQEKLAGMNRQIEEFKAAPGHEHFEDVRKQMAALMRDGLATDMQTAYDMAVWANPTTRERLQKAQQEAAEAERKAAEQKRLEAAKQAAQKAQKAAGTQLSTKASLNGGMPAPSTWDESLSRAYDRATGTA